MTIQNIKTKDAAVKIRTTKQRIEVTGLVTVDGRKFHFQAVRINRERSQWFVVPTYTDTIARPINRVLRSTR